jgi:hypothetical protein
MSPTNHLLKTDTGGKKEDMIPVSAIEHSDADSVYLNLDKASIEELPTLPRKRHWEPIGWLRKDPTKSD